MTKSELIEQLKQANLVDFGESKVNAYTTGMARLLAEAIDHTLPGDDVVRYGIETASFTSDQQGWGGKMEWLLILSCQLMRLTAVVERVSETGNAAALKILVKFVRLQGKTKATVDFDYRGRFNPELREIRGTINVAGEEIRIAGERVTAQGVAQFIAAAVAASR